MLHILIEFKPDKRPKRRKAAEPDIWPLEPRRPFLPWLHPFSWRWVRRLLGGTWRHDDGRVEVYEHDLVGVPFSRLTRTDRAALTRTQR